MSNSQATTASNAASSRRLERYIIIKFVQTGGFLSQASSLSLTLNDSSNNGPHFLHRIV